MDTTTNAAETCTCGNHACAFRISRNLRPFCRMPAPVSQLQPEPCKSCRSRPWAHGVIKCWHVAGTR